MMKKKGAKDARQHQVATPFAQLLACAFHGHFRVDTVAIVMPLSSNILPAAHTDSPALRRPPSSGEFKGRVSLGDIQCVVAADETEKRTNVTLVVTEARTYEFQAPSSEERQAWIMAININLPNSAMQRASSVFVYLFICVRWLRFRVL